MHFFRPITLVLSIAASGTATTVQPHIIRQAKNLGNLYDIAEDVIKALLPDDTEQRDWNHLEYTMNQIAGPLNELQRKTAKGLDKPENALLEMTLAWIAMHKPHSGLLWREPEIIAEEILSKWPQIAGGSIDAEIQTLKRDTYRWKAAAGYLVTLAKGTEDEYLQLLKADPDEAIKYTFAVRIALAQSEYYQKDPTKKLFRKHEICYERGPQPEGMFMRIILEICSKDEVVGQNQDENSDDETSEILNVTGQPNTSFCRVDTGHLIGQLLDRYYHDRFPYKCMFGGPEHWPEE